MQYISAIDLGSHAIRFAVAEVSRNGQYRILCKYREPIAIGQDVFRLDAISPKKIALLIETFKRFARLNSQYQVSTCRAVGTSALRDAKNGNEFVKRIAQATGINIKIISGDEEARLIRLAVSNAISLRGKDSLLIDIGGGSVEVSVLAKGKLIYSKSANLGTVRLLELFQKRNTSSKDFVKLVQDYIIPFLGELKKNINKRKVQISVGTGGNLEALLEVQQKLYAQFGDSLQLRNIKKIKSKLINLSLAERIEKLQLKKDRADVILPALIVIEAILSLAKQKSIIVPSVGLREGLLTSTSLEITKGNVKLKREDLLVFTKELGKKYFVDEKQAKKVAYFAAQIFELTKRRHKLGEEDKLLLEIAASLLDIGQFLNVESHHKHGFYILQNSQFVGLDTAQKYILALLIRFHRKGLPSKKMPEFANFSLVQYRKFCVLESILRFAESLHAGHNQSAKSVRFKLANRKFCVSAAKNSPIMLNPWSVKEKAGMMESLLGVSVVL